MASKKTVEIEKVSELEKNAEPEKGEVLSVKNLELDARVEHIIDETFSDFEKYMPTLQDVRMFQRKRREYWESIRARINKENNTNGRAEQTAGSN